MGAEGHRGRMLGKLINSGSSVSERDTLEMLLYFPIRIRDTREIAVELTEKFDGDLYRVLTASPEELCQTTGVGPSAADFLGLVGDIVTMDVDSGDIIEKPVTVSDRIYDIFVEIRDEIKGDELWAVFLDAKAKIAGKAIIRPDFGIPGDDEAYLILQKAARCHGVSMILAHVTGGLEIYPTEKDTKLYRDFKNKFSFTNLEIAGYYMVGGDEALRIRSLDRSPLEKA